MNKEMRKYLNNILTNVNGWEVDQYYLKNREAGICLWIASGWRFYKQDSFQAIVSDKFRIKTPNLTFLDRFLLKNSIENCITRAVVSGGTN